MLMSACGGSAESADADASDQADARAAATSPLVPFDGEVYSTDEGAGCGIYVSVDADQASNAGDLRQLAWQGIVTEQFSECEFSTVAEVGLITVNGLDEYGQPEWADVVEHAYFSVDSWESLVDQCFSLELSAECTTLLDANLTASN